MSGLGPPMRKSSIRSWNWPCMSPHTVTGHFCLEKRQLLGGGAKPTGGGGGDDETYHWLDIGFFLQYFSGLCETVNINSDSPILPIIQRSNAPDRTAAAHLPPLIACTSSSSRSSHPESVWSPGRSSGKDGVARATVRYRSPCCCPWWAQLA